MLESRCCPLDSPVACIRRASSGQLAECGEEHRGSDTPCDSKACRVQSSPMSAAPRSAAECVTVAPCSVLVAEQAAREARHGMSPNNNSCAPSDAASYAVVEGDEVRCQLAITV